MPNSLTGIRKKVNKYVRDVISGKVVTCKWVKLACQRYRNDRKEGSKRDIHFKEDKAYHAIEFIQQLTHSKGEWAGQDFILEPWELFVVWNLFGWLRKDDFRRFSTAYLEVARKNGKSTLLAGIGLYLFVADNEPGAEVYSAATKIDQARISHSEATRMVNQSPELKKHISVFKNNLSIADTASKFEPLASDHDTLDGLNIHGALIDELHAHKTRDLWDVLDTGTGARRQPLLFAITTAGYDKHSICWQQHAYVEKLLEGSLKDDSYFGMIYSIDKEDEENWENEKNWGKANPNLNVSVKMLTLEQGRKKAREMPSQLNSFKRLKLNIWTESVIRWLPTEAWKKCGLVSFDEESLEGRTCYSGLDLSSSIDVTAHVLVFPPLEKEEPYKIVCRFFIPEENMRERVKRDRVPYDVWVRDGFITATPGNVVDYSYVLHLVGKDMIQYNIKELAFDRWGASKIVQDLTEMGFEPEDAKHYKEKTLVRFGQGYKSMAPATLQLEKMLRAGELAHNNNPVLAWMASNVVVTLDPAGNMKPDKALALDTPLPTTYGWTNIGAVKINDILFDENGKQCKVIGVSDVNQRGDCYKITFSDGAEITADAEHKWAVLDVCAFGDIKKQLSLKTTRQMAGNILRESKDHLQYRFAIPLANKLNLKEQKFALDPYVLGCWLGDGNSSSAYISSDDPEMFNYFPDNFTITKKNQKYSYHIGGLVPHLYELGILNDKNIPEGYLRGSVNQRLALLQGLMDTDGHISAKDGYASFVNTNRELIDGCHELLISLGYKASIKESIARCKGKAYGAVWKVTFTARKELPPFKLKRKSNRIPKSPPRRARGLTRQIVSIEKTKPVPVKCITVDSVSSLFLAGWNMIPTHNSKSTERIDGIVALLMALDRATKHEGDEVGIIML